MIKIGTKPKIDLETFFHKIKVIQRRREVELTKLDNQLPALPVPKVKNTDYIKYPKRTSILLILRQLLP